ncbi:EFR1 family ferrodoxin [Anaerocolumna sp. AGMB13025]|uniref:EFR1 family ferrodoxin n=1 Tax=Anaerocolumna sp. AGMB13025 TaxID=3039116 RepID=UPI0024204B95|nr:EFR1 family ferrodoxin [Anaerocolumna sp. AGMB13025]WFR58809.1 EFR1 family ferrodoxin [Anaerocolumna sp. AGMB13025]
MSTTIYYFSATGNSLKVAKNLSEQVEECRIVRISRDNLSITQDLQSEKIGFIFPIYNFGIPSMVKKFVENLQLKKNTYVFAIATYGGMVGSPFNEIKRALKKKDVNLSAAFTINMPGSDVLLMAPASEEEKIKCFKEEKEQVLKISSIINTRQPCEYKSNAPMDALYKVMYNVSFNPQNMGKNFWTDVKCNGCGICSQVCPANNITMKNGKPNWGH